MSTKDRELVEGLLADHAALVQEVQAQGTEAIETAGAAVVDALRNGANVLACGNGGSAADAQHFAAELTGLFDVRHREALPAFALTVDSSALTSISNDFGYERVFARQVEALGRAGDVLIGISTSGRSANVLAALQRGRALGLTTIGLVGIDASHAAPVCDHVVAIPGRTTARIQEMHIFVLHAWCTMIDAAFTEGR